MKLREIQKAPYEIGVSFFKDKKAKPSLIIAPTAFGKSVVISSIANTLEEPSIVLQPSAELLTQNYNKLIALGGQASIFSASLKTKEWGHLTYATLGSIKSLGKEVKDMGVKNIIVDEADRYPKTMDSMFGRFLKSAEIENKILGFTATPFKLHAMGSFGDSYSMLKMLTSRGKVGSFYKDILHVTQIQEMVELGYWPKLVYEVYDFKTGDLKYNTNKSDFTEESIQKAYKDQHIHDKIIDKVKRLHHRKSILVFVPSVQDAIDLARRIPNSAAVYGNMDNKEREFVLEEFKALRIRVVINVNVLSVGFDHPELDAILCGRATASLSWWYQAGGRLTRPHPNKEDGLIVDFMGNVERFGKFEDLYYKKEGLVWKLYGEGGKLLTGIRMDAIGQVIDGVSDKTFSFGQYRGKPVESAPKHYRDWLLGNTSFTWNQYNQHVKDELLRLKQLEV
jgi:DNA repair protein RadD